MVCYNRSGHHVSGKEFEEEKRKEYKGIRIKTVPTIDYQGMAALTSSFMASICAAFGRYDVVHYHAEGPCAMLWLPKLFGKYCVATIHGLDWKTPKWGKLASMYIRLGERIAAKMADEVIVLNSSAKQYFMDTYGRKTVLIPNGVARPQPAEPELIKEYGLEKDNYILYLGRIVQGKGLELLISAYQRLKTDKKLVIAGGASDSRNFMNELKKRAGGNPNIIFTDFVRGRMKEELYSNACFFVMPSQQEGMPLCLLEAMSYGNCCLVSDIDVLKEMVEDHAEIFPVNDKRGLVKQMQKLCRSQALVERYRKNASDYICGKYNWDDMAERTLELYRRSGKERKR